jgi:hypothetical protein
MKYIIIILLLSSCASQSKENKQKEYDIIVKRYSVNKENIAVDSSMLKPGNVEGNTFLLKELDSLKEDQERLLKRKNDLAKELF